MIRNSWISYTPCLTGPGWSSKQWALWGVRHPTFPAPPERGQQAASPIPLTAGGARGQLSIPQRNRLSCSNTRLPHLSFVSSPSCVNGGENISLLAGKHQGKPSDEWLWPWPWSQGKQGRRGVTEAPDSAIRAQSAKGIHPFVCVVRSSRCLHLV